MEEIETLEHPIMVVETRAAMSRLVAVVKVVALDLAVVEVVALLLPHWHPPKLEQHLPPMARQRNWFDNCSFASTSMDSMASSVSSSSSGIHHVAHLI